ncbi:hypothetical protein Zm00014a_008932 [Zea mays]|uniref:Uncharacterized protein n=1 Tax=Zea mays TaxID=4577 RepID=A0A3L6EGG1_MAIZE|nr:hypothetical protein Zm00014a_008932 [Zea mays]
MSVSTFYRFNNLVCHTQ